MKKTGEMVVYKCRGIYEIEDVGPLNFALADPEKQYYTLQSVQDIKDRAYVPTEDETNIRYPIDREDAMTLIHHMGEMEAPWTQNEKQREKEYQECIAVFTPESWAKVLKTLYERTKSQGRITSMDRKYQQLLEHALFSEFSYVFEIPEENVGTFISEEALRS